MVTKRVLAKTELFISHISEEAEIAALLQEMIRSDYLGIVELFASSDIPSIRGGSEWLESIRDAIARAPAVLVLCSKASIQRPWVQFEIGAAWIEGKAIIPVCHSGLKPAELPLPLASLQGIELGTERGLRKLNAAVSSIVGMQQTPAMRDIPERLERITKLEEKFARSPIQQFERYIDIIVPTALETPEIPSNLIVESNSDSLQLFGLSGDKAKWKDIETAARETPDTRWLDQLQQCVYLSGKNRTFRSVQAVYHCAQGAFQPQLSKKEMLADGAVRFHVHLVETVVAPLFEVDNEFGLLATLLRLGLRFRYEVIQRGARGLLSIPRRKPAAAEALEAVIDQLRKAIETIENDALSRGAEKMDRGSIADLFAWDDDKTAMAAVQDDWEEARMKLFDAELSLDDVHEVVERMRQINFRFMHLGTRRFHEMVDAGWRDEPKERPGAAAAPRAAAAA